VLTRPAVRSRFEELLHAFARSQAAAQQDLAGRLRGLTGGDDAGALGGGMDLESLQGMFGDPEALLGDLLTPETRQTSDRLTALAVVVDAYADHIATIVGSRLVGAHTQLAEAWYRRRTERGKGEEAAGALFGLDLDQAAVDRGRAFVAGSSTVRARRASAACGARYGTCPRRPRWMRPACGSSGSTAGADRPRRGLTGSGSAVRRHPVPLQRTGTLRRGVGDRLGCGNGGRLGAGRLLLGQPEVPFDQDVLALGVTDDPLRLRRY